MNTDHWPSRRLTLAAALSLLPGGRVLGQRPSRTERSRPLKIGFAYVGPIGDGGWTFSHEQGRIALEQEYGDRISTVCVERVPEGKAAEPVFKELIAQGCELIFGTAFGYMETMLKLAAANPRVRFEHVNGFRQRANMRSYDVRMYQGAYLAGIAAGATSKTKSLGFVASIPIPEVVRNLNAFTLGAQSVAPDVKVFSVWVNEWFNPEAEAHATQVLLDQGVDVLAQNTDSAEVLRVAERKRVRAIGFNSDMSTYGPVAHLGSVVALWGPYYVESVRQILDGSWRTAQSWWGLKERSVDFVRLAYDMEPTVRDAIANAREGMRRGQLDMWRGPLRSRSGTVQVPSGKTLDDQQLQAIEYLVEGVRTHAPSLRD